MMNRLMRRVLRRFSFASIEKTGELPQGNKRPTERPSSGTYRGFDHLRYYCSNAYQAASFFTSRLGFEYLAYSGLETGSRDSSTHVVRNGGVTICFESSYKPQDGEISRFIQTHGDTIRDVAFEVDDCQKIFDRAVARGVKVIKPPHRIEDENGYIIKATVLGCGAVAHSLIERVVFHFLPRKTTKESLCLATRTTTSKNP